MKDRKILLSTLWTFAILNYLYCDIVGLMDANLLKQFLNGTVEGIEITPGFLLGASILMEVPISMVLFARVLPFRANKTTNITAGLIMTIVQIATVVFDTPTIYYLFFSIIEISTTIGIIWISINWKNN